MIMLNKKISLSLSKPHIDVSQLIIWALQKAINAGLSYLVITLCRLF